MKALWLVLLPLAAAAQPQSEEEARIEAAQIALVEGHEHLRAGRYREGIAAYERAYLAFPDVRHLFTIAAAWERVEGACVETGAAWTRFLEACGGCADAEAARARQAAVAERCQARVEVRSNPPGAEVRRGEAVLGRTPLAVALEPGGHALRLALDGHADSERLVQAEAGRTTAVEVELVPLGAPDRPPPDRTWAWVSFGVGTAGVAAGATFLALMYDSIDEVDGARTRSAAESARDDADREAILAQVGFGVGLAGLVGGVLLLMDWGGEPSAAATSPGGVVVRF